MSGHPDEWDRLTDRETGAGSAVEAERAPQGRPGAVLLLAAALGDLVALVAVCAGALLALRPLGNHAPLPAFAWSAGLAVLWWLAAAAVLVIVRRGTPGMLMAGLGFTRTVGPGRVLAVLAACLAFACFLGLPAVLGVAAPLLRLAAGADLAVNAPS